MISYTKIFQKPRNSGSIVHRRACRIYITNSKPSGVRQFSMSVYGKEFIKAWTRRVQLPHVLILGLIREHSL